MEERDSAKLTTLASDRRDLICLRLGLTDEGRIEEKAILNCSTASADRNASNKVEARQEGDATLFDG